MAAENTGKNNLESRGFWPFLRRWIPTSTDHIINAEKRLLSLVKYN
jgi:hypothetical protein